MISKINFEESGNPNPQENTGGLDSIIILFMSSKYLLVIDNVQ